MRLGLLFILLGLTLLPVRAQATPAPNPYEPAGDYSVQHKGGALLVYQADTLVYEAYTNGYDGVQPHILASGTKGFTCALAVAAVADQLLTWDELAAATLTEWQDDPERASITIRQLVSLTSGLWGGDGVLQGALTANKVTTALRMPVMFPAGSRFDYGPAHVYLFGEILRRKLGGEDVVAYLQRRILDPIGMTGLLMARDRAGNPNLAAGGATLAREWAKFGRLLLHEGVWEGETILPADELRQCFIGTAANPHYGIGFWLQYDLDALVPLDSMAYSPPEPNQIPAGVTLGTTLPRVILAAGAGKQRLYIIPEHQLVAVRLGLDDPTFEDAALLRLLLAASAE